MVGRLQIMQKSRNTHIHNQQNIFALKALFFIQQLHDYATSRNCINSTSRETIRKIYLFEEHIFIHKKYNQSRQLHSFMKLYSFQRAYQCILVLGNYIHSKKYIHLRNIYPFKLKAICSFMASIFNEHFCVRAHSSNIYSETVPSHLMIIISFTITIS